MPNGAHGEVSRLTGGSPNAQERMVRAINVRIDRAPLKFCSTDFVGSDITYAFNIDCGRPRLTPFCPNEGGANGPPWSYPGGAGTRRSRAATSILP
jgi:hypothetical protein